MHIVEKKDFIDALYSVVRNELVVLSSTNSKGKKSLLLSIDRNSDYKFKVKYSFKGEKDEHSQVFVFSYEALDIYNSIPI
ncbi:MAG: hypothetical protein KTR16_11645 [Acidiferrobacterales bacterium]|nr:hypothetical protein [Acidiferrobacterales bacterium]